MSNANAKPVASSTGVTRNANAMCENVCQFMRQNWLSNRVFKSFDDIVDHCCYAWNTLIEQPWKIMSIGCRDWAAIDQPI